MGRLLGFGLVLVVLTAAGLWAAPALLPEERLRHTLAAALTARTGAEVTLRGPVELTLLPRPRLSLADLHAKGDGFDVALRETVLRPPFADLLALVILGRDDPARPWGEARLDGVEVDLSGGEVALPALPALDGLALDVRRLVVRRPQAALVTFDTLRWDGRTLTAAGHGGPRPLHVELRFGGDDRRGWRLESLRLNAAADTLGFDGTIRAGEPIVGRVSLQAADVAAWRAWLEEMLAAPLHLPPLLDAAVEPLAGELAGSATVRLDADGWGLEELVAGPVTGRLAVRGGRIDGALRLEAAPDAALLRSAWQRWRAAPDLLVDVDRLRLEAPGGRLDLVRADTALGLTLRLAAAGGSDLALEGRLDPTTGRFDGAATLVADRPPPPLDAWLGPLAANLVAIAASADVAADPDRVRLEGLRFASDGLGFQGRVEWAAARPPVLTVEGTVDRATLPAGWGATAHRAALLQALADWGERVGLRADVAVRRLTVAADVEPAAARVVGRLDGAGLWLSAVELEGRDASLSVAGGLDFRRQRFDGFGQLAVTAPGRLMAAWTGAERWRLATLPAGQVGFSLAGPLAAADLEATFGFGALAGTFDGRVDLVGDEPLTGALALEHPAAGALLTELGWPLPADVPLVGPARLTAAVSSGPAWAMAGDAMLASLQATLDVRAEGDGTAATVDRLTGERADLVALSTALGLWDLRPERWLQRHLGAWPETGPLASLWPDPLALRVAATALRTADAAPATARLELRVDPTTLHLARFDWVQGGERIALDGNIDRGQRGVTVDLGLAATTAGEGLLATALGLGWLGPGAFDLEGRLRARGTTPAELVADLSGTLAVDARLDAHQRLEADGRRLALPAYRVTGELPFDRGHAPLDGLTRARGALDLALGYVVGTIDLGDFDRLRIEGPLTAPRTTRHQSAPWP